MKLGRTIVAAGCWLLAGAAALQASETGPVIVIPGRPGVPIIVNGRDISYAVVEGDWGLDRPSLTDPHILYRYGRGALIGPSGGNYFPKTGRAPRVGRKEVDIPRPLHPAESFHRSFNAQSDPTPVTPPQFMPPIIAAPNMQQQPQQRQRHGGQHHHP